MNRNGKCNCIRERNGISGLRVWTNAYFASFFLSPPPFPPVSCRVVSCRVVSCRVVSCRVVSCRVVSCRVVLSRVVSCCVVPCRVGSGRVLYCVLCSILLFCVCVFV